VQKRTRLYLERSAQLLQAQTLEEKVKWQIIYSGGLVGDTPATLADALKMVDELQFNAGRFNILCIGLIRLVYSMDPKATISCADVCATVIVGDCIKLVQDALNHV